MAQIKVKTAEVEAAAQQVHQAGATTREAVGSLGPCGVSDPGLATADAVTRFCLAWSTGLEAFAQACDSVSRRLSHAGTVYAVTESHLSDGFG